MFLLFVVLYVVFVEFNAVRNFVNADAFVSCMHCGKLLVAHLDGAETQAVVCNSFVVTAVCAACHQVGDNACIGITLVDTFCEIFELFTFVVISS